MVRQPNTVERTTELVASADEVFAWHTRRGAFERLTPPWERIEVIEREGGIADGSRLVARVRAGPASIRWVAVHRDVVPGRQFVEEQLEGPFARWVHTHRMIPDGADASLLTDHIEFAEPAGAAGRISGGRYIRSRVERMLRYRHDLLRDDIAAHHRFRNLPVLRVAVTGASGFLGASLVPFLTTGNHSVTRIVRRDPGADEVRWDPAAGRLNPADLEGIDAVVRLAGENVGSGRWSAARKERIRESRIGGTRLLSETLARLERPPKVLVAASAVGIYGDRGAEALGDDSAPGSGFFAEVAQEWEAAAKPAAAVGIRVVHPRFGVVLSPRGGALGKMLPAFRLGVAGRLGSGRQWWSWVSIDDAVGIIHHALLDEKMSGRINAVAPAPLQNAAFTEALASAVRRPALIPVPRAALRFAFGEMADAALLSSARVVPTRLLNVGYRFRHPTLEGALAHLLGSGARR